MESSHEETNSGHVLSTDSFDESLRGIDIEIAASVEKSHLQQKHSFANKSKKRRQVEKCPSFVSCDEATDGRGNEGTGESDAESDSDSNSNNGDAGDPTSSADSINVLTSILSSGVQGFEALMNPDVDFHIGSTKAAPAQRKKRANVREHSKAQREKKKVLVNELETTARRISFELNNLNKTIEVTMNAYIGSRFKRYQMVSSLLNVWISSSTNQGTEQLLSSICCPNVIVSIPITTSRYIPPGQVYLNDRRYLLGVSQILSDAASIAIMCTSITRLGLSRLCRFVLDARVNPDSFFVDLVQSFGTFKIFCKNGKITSGREINVEGMLKCTFENEKIKQLDIYYDEADFNRQILLPWGKDVAFCHKDALRICNALQSRGEQTVDRSDSCIIITSADTDFKVLNINSYGKAMIGNVVGRKLLEADWVKNVVESLLQWRPYVCEIQTGDSGNSTYHCHLYPVADDAQYNDSHIVRSNIQPSQLQSRNIVPTKILWEMTKCSILDNVAELLAVMVRMFSQLVNSILLKYEKVLASSPSFGKVFTPMQEMLQQPGLTIVKMLEFIVRWIGQLEQYSDDLQEILAKQWKGLNEAPATKALQIIEHLLREIDILCIQFRESGLLQQLLLVLRIVKSKEEADPIIKFIFLCWSKHANPRICILLDKAQISIARKEFDKAVSFLTEIIAIDPTFLEAYNLRATAFFGLQKLQNCLGDLGFIIPQYPSHFGALSSLGYVFFTMGYYSKSLKYYDDALIINPFLLIDPTVRETLRLYKEGRIVENKPC